jgi:hypothetical protein
LAATTERERFDFSRMWKERRRRKGKDHLRPRTATVIDGYMNQKRERERGRERARERERERERERAFARINT